MKAFWDDYFYDMDECGMSREEMAEKAGKDIRDDFDKIKRAIESHDGKQALFFIEELKRYY
jgi:hypothetical protein